MVSAAFGTVTGALDRRFVPGFCIMHRAGIGKAVTLSADSAQRQEMPRREIPTTREDRTRRSVHSTHLRYDLTSTPESVDG